MLQNVYQLPKGSKTFEMCTERKDQLLVYISIYLLSINKYTYQCTTTIDTGLCMGDVSKLWYLHSLLPLPPPWSLHLSLSLTSLPPSSLCTVVSHQWLPFFWHEKSGIHVRVSWLPASLPLSLATSRALWLVPMTMKELQYSLFYSLTFCGWSQWRLGPCSGQLAPLCPTSTWWGCDSVRMCMIVWGCDVC